jgi:HAD superfamily hydrolase (TIGR01549 family)
MLPAALLDVDGTLVDTNYHHTLAWARAFESVGIDLPLWQIHRQMGMGGDKLVAALIGDEGEAEVGDRVRGAEKDRYLELIGEVRPFAGARELLVSLRDRGHAVVLASSAKQYEVDHYLDLLDAHDVVQGWTTSADVEATKPEPDLVLAAREKAGGGSGVLVGDSTWDCEAAGRAGIDCVGVLTGGFAAAELREAGAAEVFETLTALRHAIDRTPLRSSPGEQ